MRVYGICHLSTSEPLTSHPTIPSTQVLPRHLGLRMDLGRLGRLRRRLRRRVATPIGRLRLGPAFGLPRAARGGEPTGPRTV